MKTKLLFEIIKKEIRDVIRDKKTLIMMIIVPLFLYPVLFGFMMQMENEMMNVEESTYKTIGFAFEPDDNMNEVIKELEIEKIVDSEKKLKNKLDKEDLIAYITLKDNNFTIFYSGENRYGEVAVVAATELIEAYQKVIQANILVSNKIDPTSFFNIYTIEVEETTGKDALTEMVLGMIPTFIIMTTTLTAIFASIDMTAGEKERGTLETLLTFPLKKETIIGGKFIATSICTMISAVLGFASMYGVLFFLSGKLEAFTDISMLSVSNLVLAVILLIIYSFLISVLSIVLASSAKSFKEAQNVTQPLSIISVIPMFMTMIGTNTDLKLSLIPFINVNLLLTDIISNNLDIKLFLTAVVSSIVFIVILLKIVSTQYKSDKILFQ